MAEHAVDKIETKDIREALYGADIIALLVTFSIWAFAVQAVFLFKWFQGQKALKDLNEPLAVTT